jgi:hypothetical protein
MPRTLVTLIRKTTMRQIRLIVVVAMVLCTNSSVQGSFHLFQITELYSNADGSIQFVELTALAGGQQFLTGHTIRSTQGGSSHTYTFTTNLPGDTAGKTVLVGTAGFAALNLVTPDYVVPNGFLFTTGGTVEWAEGADRWNYGALPTSGRYSRARAGGTATNSPRNFAGATGTVFLPQAADLDGDVKADITVFRPSTAMWYSLQSRAGYSTQAWGLSSDTLVPGDYDGDGRTDLGLYRASTGTWFILQSSTNYTTFLVQPWGLSTDIAVPADYDGDGRTDLGLFRPSTGTWYILQSSTNYATFILQAWGASGDVTVPGDYDGDGKADLGVFRPSTGTWFILQSSTNYTTFVAPTLGLMADVTVPGDYDGDGKTDLGVFRASTATWYITPSSGGPMASQQWGLSTDVAVPADYDGDGKTDLGVFRPSTGIWYILQSSSNYTSFLVQPWGLATDTPINGRP